MRPMRKRLGVTLGVRFPDNSEAQKLPRLVIHLKGPVLDTGDLIVALLTPGINKYPMWPASLLCSFSFRSLWDKMLEYGQHRSLMACSLVGEHKIIICSLSETKVTACSVKNTCGARKRPKCRTLNCNRGKKVERDISDSFLGFLLMEHGWHCCADSKVVVLSQTQHL